MTMRPMHLGRGPNELGKIIGLKNIADKSRDLSPLAFALSMDLSIVLTTQPSNINFKKYYSLTSPILQRKALQ
jgi:hypothetical protein